MADDEAYFTKRAEQCLASADRAGSAEVLNIHMDLHARYRKILKKAQHGTTPVSTELAGIRGH